MIEFNITRIADPRGAINFIKIMKTKGNMWQYRDRCLRISSIWKI